MKYHNYLKLILIGLLIFPWFTFPLLGKDSLKRYFLSSTLISFFVKGESIIAKKRKWWWAYENLHPKLSGEFPLIWGPFFIGSLWILKLTYGNFILYLTTNLVIDTLFVYPFVAFCKKIGLGSLVRLKKYQLSLLFFLKSLLLYGVQFLKEKKQNI